jgi:hypothetical protein
LPSRSLCLLLLLLLGVACRGSGMHRKGEKMWSVQAQYGHSIPGDSLSGEVFGTAPTVGLGVFNHWYVTDRIALGVGATPTLYFEDVGTVFGAEFNGQIRWHFWEYAKLGFFLDLQGGLQVATADVPTGGTQYNFSYGIGPGLEVLLDDKWRMLGGVLLHHFSNGKGLGIDVQNNPSQNEARFWLGFGSTW